MSVGHRVQCHPVTGYSAGRCLLEREQQQGNADICYEHYYVQRYAYLEEIRETVPTRSLRTI